ncbi:MAG: response regulator [Pseudomonadota bacterium]|nr:response regulator [Pseudomonadota bacterium]
MEAVRALETLPYDLAFLDISMPEMDGREALAEVLSRQRRNRLARQINRPDIPPLPIIALTANVMSGDRESYLADGFTAVISKPFEERELLEAILNFAPAPEYRDPLAPLDAQSDEAHGIDLIVLDQLAERLGDGFTQTSVEIFTAEINQRLSAMAAVSGSGPASDDEAREQISREAHAIKGAAATYGLSALSALAAELEADPGRLDEVTPELTRLWSRAAAALDRWAKQKRTQG